MHGNESTDKIAINQLLRNIPSVNEVLLEVSIACKTYGQAKTTDTIRVVINQYRMEVREGLHHDVIERQAIKEYLIKLVEETLTESVSSNNLKKVINATGVVLHTNLGRAPLSEKVLKNIMEVATGYCNLEYDLKEGQRGSRYAHIEELFAQLVGAESCIVVNNNAAAVFLCLNTLAKHQEVVVSRSEQVEIGGSFRIPEIIIESGAKMVEVGTTNKTYLRDYEKAINEETKILLKVHKSNYSIEGFTSEVHIDELAGLGQEKDVIVIKDLGSGTLVNLAQFALPQDLTVSECIQCGVDLVTFSGDKLLGGPQAGIIAGKKALIDKIKKNPLTRMVRIDKLSLAGLEELLRAYINEQYEDIPVIDMLRKDSVYLEKEAMSLQDLIAKNCGDQVTTRVVEESDRTGGGSLPCVDIKGRALAIEVAGMKANQVEQALRAYRIPIIGKINKGQVRLNLRTLDRKDYKVIVDALKEMSEDR